MISGKALSWRIYVYIGITPLCLYNSPWKLVLQDGIFYKKVRFLPCKSEKIKLKIQLSLTQGVHCAMMDMLGWLLAAPFYFLRDASCANRIPVIQ